MYRPFNTYLFRNQRFIECVKAIVHEISLLGMEIMIVAVKEEEER